MDKQAFGEIGGFASPIDRFPVPLTDAQLVEKLAEELAKANGFESVSELRTMATNGYFTQAGHTWAGLIRQCEWFVSKIREIEGRARH